MFDPEKEKTRPLTLQGKEAVLYSGRDFYVFIAISIVLIFANGIGWLGFIFSLSNTIGGSWGKIVVTIGLIVISLLLVLAGFLLFIFYRKSPRGLWIVWGLLIAFLVIAVGVFAGIRSGLNTRLATERGKRLELAAEYFNYSIESMNQGNYELAKSQLMYVNDLVPGFPGLLEKLTEVEMKLALALTPIATPTLTPTPDTRGIREMFDQAKLAIQAQDWNVALSNLESMRNLEPGYNAIEADAMYYLVLRMLGVQQINGGDLESGIYDLTLAEHFAPLDREAEGSREWARRYLTAAAYWGIDWEAVVNLFAPIASNWPYLQDINGRTAISRFIEGMIRFGDQYAARGDACNAVHQYNLARDSLSQIGLNESFVLQGDTEDLQTKINNVYLVCYPPTSTPEPTYTPTPTESIVITETDTPTP
jgi:hypothetical protein